jgi:hypothetical protein
MTLPIAHNPNPGMRAHLAPRPASAQELRVAAEAVDGVDLTGGEVLRSGVFGGIASTAATAGPSIAAHELGHAVAANAVYQNANPSISVQPFKGGVCRYTAGPLTDLGQKLGPNGARALVAGAGTLVDATSAAVAFAVGYKIRKEHPVLGPALMGYGGFTVLNSMLYAGTALKGSLPLLAKQGNDFAALATSIGLPPLASIALLGALLPAEYLLLRHLEKQAG